MNSADAIVRLRPFAPTDALALARGVRASLPELALWLPWATANYGEVEATAFIDSTTKGHSHDFVIDVGGKLAGACALNMLDASTRRANVGYWITTPLSGRGYVTRAVSALVAWAFAETDFERLEIVAAVGNVASQRVAERVGAVREGVLARRAWVRKHPDHEPSLESAVLYALVRPKGTEL